MNQTTVINCNNLIINCEVINKDTPNATQEKFPTLREIVLAISTLLAIRAVNYIMENFEQFAAMLGVG